MTLAIPACGKRQAAPPKLLKAAKDWLSLAASPTFAATALSAGPSDMLCSAAQHTSSLDRMGAMYLLMSLFHLSPWLRLLARRRSAGVS